MADMAVRERIINQYAIGRRIGYGTFGVVYEAFDQVAQKSVAVKELKPEQNHQEGKIMPAENVTEIQILSTLDHPNIIQLLEVYEHDNKHHLVLELMDTDLNRVIQIPSITLSPADCKSYMHMFLQGLAYLHHNSILHRDLKPDNLLIGCDGQLNLADFGHSCYCQDNTVFSTSQVFVTRYRAAVKGLQSLWTRGRHLGCWMHLWRPHPPNFILHEAFQLRQIYERFPVPSKSQSQSICEELEYCPLEYLSKVLPEATEDGLDLLQQMFAYDPKRRITAQQALQHRYFTSAPVPTPPSLLPWRAPTRKRGRTMLSMKGMLAKRRLTSPRWSRPPAHVYSNSMNTKSKEARTSQVLKGKRLNLVGQDTKLKWDF